MAEERNDLPLDDYEPDILTLQDEEGKEYKFEVIDAADCDDEHYLAVVPYAENAEDIVEENAELILFRVAEDENGEEYLDVVEDEEELVRVSKVFETRLSEIYDIDADAMLL